MIYKSDQIRILDPQITRITAHDWLHLPTKFSKLEVSILLLLVVSITPMHYYTQVSLICCIGKLLAGFTVLKIVPAFRCSKMVIK